LGRASTSNRNQIAKWLVDGRAKPGQDDIWRGDSIWSDIALE